MLLSLLDDSDHHYESLYSIQQQLCNNNALEAKSNQESTLSLPSREYRKFRDNSDIYDSFDDSEEEESIPNNDVSNKKLPELPSASQQGNFSPFLK